VRHLASARARAADAGIESVPIPDFQSLMLPVLRELAERIDEQRAVVRDRVARDSTLMIDYGVGVSEVQTIKLMKLDEDWFAEQ
jgi:restriction endonuclease Mrr